MGRERSVSIDLTRAQDIESETYEMISAMIFALFDLSSLNFLGSGSWDSSEFPLPLSVIEMALPMSPIDDPPGLGIIIDPSENSLFNSGGPLSPVVGLLGLPLFPSGGVGVVLTGDPADENWLAGVSRPDGPSMGVPALAGRERSCRSRR